MAVKSRGAPGSGARVMWVTGIVLVALVLVVTGDKVEFSGIKNTSTGRLRRSPKWTIGSSRKSSPSPSPSPSRVTSAPSYRATSAPSWRATTSGYHAPTTSAPPRRATTSGPIFSFAKKTTTTKPFFPKQVYQPPPTPAYPRPMYPVPPHPPPIYVPPPPPNNPTIIIIKDNPPKAPSPSIFGTGIGAGIGSAIGSSIGSHHHSSSSSIWHSRRTTQKPTTTTTTTTRRPKTTTEEPWHGIEGGYDKKIWVDMVKNTQRKDVPLSGQWVRIRGGKSMREGYVEIVGEGGVWGSVCDVPGRWDLHKASIVCRQMGYRGGAEAAWMGRPADNSSQSQPLPSHVREVNCGLQTGTLLHCSLRRSKDGHPSEIDVNGTCFERTRDVGVRCRPEPNTVCRFGEKAFGKSCYRVVLPPSHGGAKEFAEIAAAAVKTCRRGAVRSELVSVTTQAENDFLSDWLQAEHPGVHQVLTSGIGTHSHLGGVNRPLVEWWLWSGQYRDITFENWWPGWTSNPTITPIVPPKSMMVILLQNKFPRDPKKDRYADKIVDYFYWTAKTGTDTSKPIAFICERPADDVGCLTDNQEYTGPANISESGKGCLNWGLQEVRNSSITAGLFLVAPAATQELLNSGGNACRRLTLDKEPWCFVSPGAGLQPVPEQCLIPLCGQPSAITSYYEAPKKTNNYAPNFNQIPPLVPPPTSAVFSAPLPATIPFPISAVPSQTRTLSETQMITNVASAPGVNDVVAKSPEDQKPWLPTMKGSAPEPPPPLPPLNYGPVPTLQPPPTTLTSPMGPSEDAFEMPRVLSFPVPKTQIEELPRHFVLEAVETIIPAESEKALNDTECNANETTCIPTVTKPPHSSPPPVLYPHPENEIPFSTASPALVIPKRSLYGGVESIKTRYAAGKGRPFERTLSSSDLILLLNGILPQEDDSVAASARISETTENFVETDMVEEATTTVTGERPTGSAAEAATEIPSETTVEEVTGIPGETTVETVTRIPGETTVAGVTESPAENVTAESRIETTAADGSTESLNSPSEKPQTTETQP